MGAGDAKFIAAAAPFVALGDASTLAFIFAATLLGAFLTHRAIKHSPLRRLAPDWQSWHAGKKFPMGFALGGTLAIYLGLGALYGT
jgi:prepilin peptidase CpaA